MKKVFYATLALGALILASCQKENSVELPKVDSPVFTASFDTDATDTKTVLVTDGSAKKSHWVKDDAIRVFNGEGDGKINAIYTTTESGASATFTTTNESFTGEEFMALYPASPAGDAVWKKDFPENIDNLWLTGAQTAVVDSYDPAAHLAYARAVNNKFSFSNMVTLLKFTIAQTSKEVSSISVTVPDSEYIAGNFNFKVKVGESPMEFYKDKGSTHLSIASLSGTFEAGKSYYLAVLPGTYSSLTLKVNNKEYKVKDASTTFEANKVYDLGSIDVQDEQKEIVMTIDKQNSWDNLYIYAWDSSDNKPFGAWPGTKVEGNTVTFPKTYYKGEMNFNFSTKVTESNTVQTKDQKKTLTEDFTFILPSDENYFVLLNTEFTDKHGRGTYNANYLYAWYVTETNSTINNIWPGAQIKDHEVYSYKYVELTSYPASYNFILHYQGPAENYQSVDLTTGTNSVTKGTTNYRF